MADGFEIETDGGEGTNESPQDAVAEIAADPEFKSQWASVFGGGDQAAASAEEAEATPGDEGDEEVTPVPPVVKAPVGKPAKEVATPASTLSPVLRQAAKRNGWSDTDIDGFYVANPELADKTFERLHGSYNDLSSQYAKLGQGRFQAQAQGGESGVPDKLASLFSEDSLKTFKRDYGDDFVNKFLAPLKDELTELRGVAAYVEQQKLEGLNRLVTTTLDGFGKDMPELYGETSKATPEQQEFRRQVVQHGDWIIAGAAAQGIELSHREALERAHMALTAEKRTEIERKNLTASIKKRAGNVTLRPTQRKAAVKPSGEQALEAAQTRGSELGIWG